MQLEALSSITCADTIGGNFVKEGLTIYNIGDRYCRLCNGAKAPTCYGPDDPFPSRPIKISGLDIFRGLG